MLTVNRVISTIVKYNARLGIFIDCRWLTIAINNISKANSCRGFVPGRPSRFVTKIGPPEKGANMSKIDSAFSSLFAKKNNKYIADIITMAGYKDVEAVSPNTRPHDAKTHTSADVIEPAGPKLAGDL